MAKKIFKRYSKKQISITLLIIIGLPLISIAFANAGIIDTITEKVDKTIFGQLQYAEGWGIYYATVLAKTIHTKGLLYWIALIMFIWGFWSKIFPAGFTAREVDPTVYYGRFVMWFVYFFIMLYLIGTPYSNPLNPVRNIVYLSDALTSNLTILLNGSNDPSVQEFVDKQIRQITIPQFAKMDYIPADVKDEMTDYIKECMPDVTKIKSTSTAIAKDKIAMPVAEALAFRASPAIFMLVSAVNLGYAAIKGVDGGAINTQGCEDWRKDVVKDIKGAFDSRIEDIAKARGISDIEGFKESVKKRIEKIGAERIIVAYGCIPTKNPDFVNLVEGAEKAYSYCAGSSESTYSEDDALIAGLVSNSVGSEENLYEKLRKDIAEGTNTSENVGFSIKRFFHWASAFVKGAIGALSLAFVSSVIRIVMPFAVQIAYLVNGLIYGFLVMFIPFVMTLALQSEKNLTMIIKYTFLVIWAKSWIIPIALFTNYYINYLDASFNLSAPLALMIMFMLTPTLMGIVLLEGSSVIGKLDVGLDKMLGVAGGFVGAITTNLVGLAATKLGLPFLSGGGGGGGGAAASGLSKFTKSPSSSMTKMAGEGATKIVSSIEKNKK